MMFSKPYFSSSCWRSSRMVRRWAVSSAARVDDGAQLVEVEGLFDVVERPLLQGRAAGLHGGVGGDEDDLRAGASACMAAASTARPSRPRPDQVGDDDVEGLRLQARDGRRAVVHDRAAVAQPRQALLDGLGVGRLVLDDQDVGRSCRKHFHSGSHCISTTREIEEAPGAASRLGQRQEQ